MPHSEPFLCHVRAALILNLSVNCTPYAACLGVEGETASGTLLYRSTLIQLS